MKHIPIFLTFFLFIAPQLCFSTYNPYDLSLRGIGTQHSDWRITGYNYKAAVDSLTFNNRSPFCISNKTESVDNIFLRSNHFSLYRLIPLSEQEAIINCELEAKINNYKNVWLKLYCLDERENIICADSMQLLNDNEWHKSNLSVKTTDLQLLGIEIIGMSVNDAASVLWLDQFKITINGHDLSDKQYSSKQELKDIGKNPIDIPLNNLDSIKFERLFKGHKIVGLGETIHGSQQMAQLACQIIKSQVLRNNCRLILLERGFSEVASWNLFVNNSLEVTADSLVNMTLAYQDPSSLIDLLNWLKYYNQNNQDKVNIVGIDKSKKNIEMYYTANYLELLKKGPNATMDTLMMHIRTGQFSRAIAYINKTQESMEVAIGKKECEILKYALTYPADNNDTLGIWNKTTKFLYDRDKVMWENMQFAIQNYIKNDTQNITIFAHLGHLNKLYTNEFLFKRSLGYYIHKKYNSDYHVCAFIAGVGHFTNASFIDGVINENNKIDEPVPGSLEGMCMKEDRTCFYSHMPDKSQIISHRLIGNSSLNTLDYGDLTSRMDSYTFIRNNSGFKIPSSWPREIKYAGNSLKKDNWAKIKKLWK